MSNRFFIAVGGTGQHIALAYADLLALAHGVVDDVPNVQFCLVDMDQMGAGSASEKQSAWQHAEQQVQRLWVADKGASAGRPPTHRIDPCANDLEAHRRKVIEVVDPQYGPMVFNPKQLDVQFRDGFFGQPSVAALMFMHAFAGDRVSQSEALKAIATADAGRKVIVAGSMVGGTGAGCLPALIETLATDKNRKIEGEAPREADIMALVMLKWFRLEKAAEDQSGHDAATRNETIRRNEPSGLIYARERLAKHAATVLVGHPSIENEPATTYEDNTGQSVKRNLTLPYAAAIVASNFHAASGVQRGAYAIVAAEDTKEARIPREKALFGGSDGVDSRHRIRDLAIRNLDLCHRLAWIHKYLTVHPGAGRSWFGGHLRVDFLEPLLGQTRLLTRIDAMLEAKWAALVRLYKSDPSIFGGDTRITASDVPWTALQDASRRPPMGLRTIESWFDSAGTQLEPDTDALRQLCGQLLRTIADPADPKPTVNKGFLLPAGQAKAAGILPKERLGGIEEISQNVVQGLIPYEHVTPEGLPHPRAMETFLDLHFSGKLTGKDRLPNKHAAVWAKRWQIMLAGLASERFKLMPPRRDSGSMPVTGGILPQWIVVDTKSPHSPDPVVLGCTSSVTLLLPSAGAPWADLEADFDKAVTWKPARRTVASWAALLKEVFDNSGGQRDRSCAWLFRGLEGIDTNVADRADFLARNGSSIRVEWPGGPVDLPIPFVVNTPGGIGDATPHLQTVLRELRVDLRPLSVSQARGLGGEFQLLHQLEDDEKFPVFVPLGPTVKDATPRKVIWRDLHPDLARFLAKSAILRPEFQDGHPRCVAYFIERGGGGLAILDPEEVLLTTVEPITEDLDSGARILPNYPVRLEYAGLIDLSRPVPNAPTGMEESSAQYSVPLRGRPDSYVKLINIGRAKAGSWMLWPKFRLPPLGDRFFKAYTARAQNAVDTSTTCFLGIDHKPGDATPHQRRPMNAHRVVASAQHPQPLYRRSRDGASYEGLVPEGFTILAKDNQLGCGIFSTRLTTSSWLAEERWGIDFGSSSSVVAACAGGTKAMPVAPRGSLDQTIAYALASPPRLSDCDWFPTWNDRGPRLETAAEKVQPLFSSKLLLRKAVPGGSHNFNADDKEYGTDYIIDHGGQVSKEFFKKESYLDELKWSSSWGEGAEPAKRSQRRAYLRHLLEMSFILRASARNEEARLEPGLPRSIRTVFTLPIRLATLDEKAASGFADDVNTVRDEIASLLGVTINTSFMWESHAGAPAPHMQMAGTLYAVSDLGGGSLDMWGRVGNGTEQYADSYKFGGHNLTSQSIELYKAKIKTGAIEDIDFRRELRSDQVGDSYGTFFRKDGQARDLRRNFFEEAKEATARWVASLAVAACQDPSVPLAPRLELSLLGMGWDLAPDAGNKQSQLDDIRKDVFNRANELLRSSKPNGFSGRWPERIDPGSTSLEPGIMRKTYLARYAAMPYHGNTNLEDLVQHLPKTFLGFDLHFQTPAGDKTVGASWVSIVPVELGATEVWRMRFDPKHSGAQPVPRIPARDKEHDLEFDEITKILDALSETGRTGRFVATKSTPMALVLEELSRGRAILATLVPSIASGGT